MEVEKDSVAYDSVCVAYYLFYWKNYLNTELVIELSNNNARTHVLYSDGFEGSWVLF